MAAAAGHPPAPACTLLTKQSPNAFQGLQGQDCHLGVTPGAHRPPDASQQQHPACSQMLLLQSKDLMQPLSHMSRRSSEPMGAHCKAITPGGRSTTWHEGHETYGCCVMCGTKRNATRPHNPRQPARCCRATLSHHAPAQNWHARCCCMHSTTTSRPQVGSCRLFCTSKCPRPCRSPLLRLTKQPSGAVTSRLLPHMCQYQQGSERPPAPRHNTNQPFASVVNSAATGARCARLHQHSNGLGLQLCQHLVQAGDLQAEPLTARQSSPGRRDTLTTTMQGCDASPGAGCRHQSLTSPPRSHPG